MDTAAVGAGKRAQSDGTFSEGMKAELQLLRQFGVKLKAGLAVEKCLAALVGETKNRRLREACKAMHAQMARGSTLSLAMRDQLTFDAAAARIVELGEQAGNLEAALANASDYLERTGRLDRAMHHAVAKPLNVLILVLLAIFIATVSLSFLVKEALPEPSTLHHATLGLANQVGIKVAQVVRKVWPFLGVLGLLNFLALQLLPRRPGARVAIERVALKLPLAAAATRATAQARFVRTVGTLMRTGALLGEAMALAAATAKHLFMRTALALTVQKIEAGKPYIEAMVEGGFLRRRDINTVQAAERRGELATFMLAFADECEREAFERIGTLTSVAHTAVVALLGLAIAAVVLSLYVPVFVSS
jgi:type II secretory pathway component PulF